MPAVDLNFSQLQQRHRTDFAHTVRCAVERFIMDHDDFAIGTQMYIEFDAINMHQDRFLKRFQRVFGRMATGAAMSDGKHIILEV